MAFLIVAVLNFLGLVVSLGGALLNVGFGTTVLNAFLAGVNATLLAVNLIRAYRLRGAR